MVKVLCIDRNSAVRGAHLPKRSEQLLSLWRSESLVWAGQRVSVGPSPSKNPGTESSVASLRHVTRGITIYCERDSPHPMWLHWKKPWESLCWFPPGFNPRASALCWLPHILCWSSVTARNLIICWVLWILVNRQTWAWSSRSMTQLGTPEFLELGN